MDTSSPSEEYVEFELCMHTHNAFLKQSENTEGKGGKNVHTSSPSGEYVEFELFMHIHIIFEAEHRASASEPVCACFFVNPLE